MSSTRSTCPFCAAPWSDEMLAQYDSYSEGSTCACSVHREPHVHQAQAAEQPDLPPLEDIRCSSCGRAIYRAPAVLP